MGDRIYRDLVHHPLRESEKKPPLGVEGGFLVSVEGSCLQYAELVPFL